MTAAARELHERPAGHELANQLDLEEQQRAIVRQHLATGTPLSAVAADVGVTPHRLRSFLDGGEPRSEAERERLGRWCHGRPAPHVLPETVAVALLARWAHKKDQRWMRTEIGRAVLALYRRTSVRLPPWVAEALEPPA